MADSRFFPTPAPRTLQEIVEATGARLHTVSAGALEIHDVAPLDRAQSGHVSFLDNTKYVDSFRSSAATACFVREKFIDQAPEGIVLLISDDPYRNYAITAQLFYPFVPIAEDISPQAMIDPSAIIGRDCSIGPGAVLGKGVVIGDRTAIGANAVLHDGVNVGSDTRIGALSSLSHALIGDRVIIHRGVHIGQDGFGFAMSREGHVKVPQLGRVVIEDEVEIGAGTCIDRGTGPDTVVGAGTKIDNLVQIGHNAQIGQRSVMVAQSGVAGSTRVGDGVVLGGQVGIAGHLRIGHGVKIAAQSGVMTDIPSGVSYGGCPAVPIKEWHRQSVALSKLTKPKKKETHD